MQKLYCLIILLYGLTCELLRLRPLQYNSSILDDDEGGQQNNTMIVMTPTPPPPPPLPS